MLSKHFKFIKEMGQNVYKMTKESLEYLKSFFQMDSHCKLRVSGNREVEVFWSKNNSEFNSWRCEIVKTFKHLVEKGPNVMV